MRLKARRIYYRRPTLVVVSLIIIVAILLGAGWWSRVRALTAVLVPDSTVSSNWTGSYTAIDEGTATTSDYINTGTTANASARFGASDMAGLSSASSVTLTVCAYSATNANGGILDNLTINLLVNGVTAATSTVTPVYSSTSTCTNYSVTASGSYTLADINSSEISFVAAIKGSGSTSKQTDDLRIANAYLSVNYMPNTQLTQSAYRLYQPQDSVAPGAPLAAQNTAGGVGAGGNFRLRQLLATSANLSPDSYLKLQYAAKSGSCDTGFSGESYQDVTFNGKLGAARTAAIANNRGTWTNSSDALTTNSTGAYYSGGTSTSVSGYLDFTGFGFSIPSDATVQGVTVTFREMADGTGSPGTDVQDSTVNILKNGVAGSANKAKGVNSWPTSAYAPVAYGSASDTWGETWAPADINAANFGVTINVTSLYNPFDMASGRANIDSVSIAVAYTTSAMGAQYIQYADMSTVTGGQAIATTANDPTSSNTIAPQAFITANPYSTVSALSAGQDGLWDFSLKTAANASGSYCFRTINSDGNIVSAYNYIPELVILPATVTQANYRWFANADSAGPGAPLVPQDTGATMTSGMPFRLRQRFAVDSTSLSPSVQTYKLQYAEKSGTCDPGFSGEAYIDITGSDRTASGMGSSATEDTTDSYGSSWSAGVATLNVTGGYTGIASGGVGAHTYLANLTGYGFSVPANATVTGISIDLPYAADVNSPSYYPSVSAKPIVNGTPVGALEGQSITTTGSGNITLGGPSSLFHLSSLSPAEVNASTFGISLTANAPFDSYDLSESSISIDTATVTVYYTLPSAFKYYNNATPADLTAISSSGNDPVNSARPTVYQTYRETDPFTNSIAAIPAGSDGLWDFSLASSAAAAGKTYCLRTVKSDGSLLDSYSYIPEIAFSSSGGVSGPTLDQQLRGGQSVMSGVKGKLLW